MVNNENTIVRSKLKREKEILVDSSVVRRRAHYPEIDNPLAHLIDPWLDNYIHVLLCFLPLLYGFLLVILACYLCFLSQV